MRVVLPAVIATVLLGSGQARAQNALDRIDPTEPQQQEELPAELEQRGPTIRVETPDRTRPTHGASYSVGAIAVTGLAALPPAAFVDIVEAFSARALSPAELETLADRIARRARERGYPFASAWIAPQRLDAGVLFVTVDEGAIGRIDLPGADSPAVRATLAPLASGRPVTLAELERRLLLVRDIGGTWVRRTRYERQAGIGVLIVEIDHDPVSARLELNNDGSRPIGPERARLSVQQNGVFTGADLLAATLSVTPFEPEELQFGHIRYANRISTAGTELGIAGAISGTRPGAYLADRDILGQSWRFELDARHPVLRRRAASLWIEGALEVRDLRQERGHLLARHDRVTALRAGLYGLADLAGGRLRGRLSVAQGLDLFGATDQGDPLASRPDASPDFTLLSGWADWTAGLAKRVSVRLSATGQLSTQPLLVSEEIGLGGTRFLRGYNYNERSGEQGIIGGAELRYDLPQPVALVRHAQLYVFGDGGVVGNLRDGRGGGSLASAGAGVRTAVTRDLGVDLQLAFPLTGPRYDTRDRSPRFTFAIRQAF